MIICPRNLRPQHSFSKIFHLCRCVRRRTWLYTRKARITDCETLGQSLCRSRITFCGFIKHGLPFVDYEHGLHKLFLFYSKFQRPRFSSRDALRIEELKIEDMNVSSYLKNQSRQGWLHFTLLQFTQCTKSVDVLSCIPQQKLHLDRRRKREHLNVNR
jgi:hypothetical protein